MSRDRSQSEVEMSVTGIDSCLGLGNPPGAAAAQSWDKAGPGSTDGQSLLAEVVLATAGMGVPGA